MITAEELEECDILPKQYTLPCIIKASVYLIAMIASCALMYSFYSGKDFVSIITMESTSYSSTSYLIERLASIDKKFDYTQKDSYYVNHTANISDFFIKQYVNQNLACLIKQGSDGFGIFDLYNRLNGELNHTNDELYVETKSDPHMAFFKKGFTFEKMTYSNYSIMTQMKERTVNYFINELDLSDIRSDLFKSMSESLKGDLFKKDLKLNGIYFTEGFDKLITPGHSENTENFICMAKGEIDVMLIPSSGRKYVYPYKREYGPTNYSPVNFFRGDSSKYPLYTKADRIHVTIGTGDCLYIPSFWWISIKSYINTHFSVVSLKFEGSSRIVNDIMQGIMLNQI